MRAILSSIPNDICCIFAIGEVKQNDFPKARNAKPFARQVGLCVCVAVPPPHSGRYSRLNSPVSCYEIQCEWERGAGSHRTKPLAATDERRRRFSLDCDKNANNHIKK